MNDLIRALTGTVNAPVLTFRRDYPTTRGDLWAACTEPDRVARWLGTISGAPCAVGDEFTLTIPGEADAAQCRVRACDAEGFTVDWAWPGEADSIVEVRFAPAGAGTTLTLVHTFVERAPASDYGSGWEHHLTLLARGLGAEPPVGEPGSPGPWSRMTRAPLSLERVLAAPRERVWQALASAEGLSTWWWSHWSGVDIEADVRRDGTYRITAREQGIEISGTYLAVDQPAHLAFTWCWRDSDGASRDEAVDIRLDEVDTGTRITLTHSGPWPDDAPASSYRQGWEFTLDQLAAAVAVGVQFGRSVGPL